MAKQKPTKQKPDALGRRQFLGAAGLASAGALAGAAGPAAAAQDETSRVLLGQLADAILAPKSPMPGVEEIGVVDFVQRRFADSARPALLPSGLNAVREEVRFGHGPEATFSSLGRAARESLLTLVREGRIRAEAWHNVPSGAAEFYRQLRFHLVDAFYSHPEVQAAIGFGGAAQFIGHPDFTELPEPDDG